MSDELFVPEPPVFDYLEYSVPPDEEKWRVERGSALIADFEMDGPDDVPVFHGSLVSQEAEWKIVRRLYGIAPMLGVEDLDDLRVWKVEELATQTGKDAKQIEGVLAGVRNFWRAFRLRSGTAAESPVVPKAAVPPPNADEIERLLLAHGFIGIDDEEERKFIATRIKELEAWLEMDNLRSGSRSAIQQESTMLFVIDPTIRELRKKIKDSSVAGGSSDQRKELLALVRARGEASAALEKTLESIGATDKEGSGLRKKMLFADSASGMLDGMKAFYSDGDRTLIDGMNTAAEVELLTTEQSIRPIQYRPDLVAAVWEAQQHLWESDWSPSSLARRVCRKLMAGFKRGLEEIRAEDGEEEPKTDEEILGLEAEKAPVSEATPVATPPVPTIITGTPPPPRASRRDETPVMVVMDA